jgi:tight adherence protein C
VDPAHRSDSRLTALVTDMTVQQLLLFGATFGFATTFAWLVLSIGSQARARRRLSGLTKHAAAKRVSRSWREQLLAFFRPLARLSQPKEAWENSPLRMRFLQAGWRQESAATIFLGIKTATVTTFPAVFLLVGPDGMRTIHIAFFALLLAAVGYYLPDVVLRQKTTVRQRELLNNFPDAVDLLTVCVEAGLSLDAALSRVADEFKVKCAVLADELHLVNLELRAGGTRQQALRNLALRTGLEELNAFVGMLVQAERFGTSIADSLRVYSAELRMKRRVKAEEAAAKIALKLLFPLIFFLFPALMLVLMGPAMINIARTLLPAMGAR